MRSSSCCCYQLQQFIQCCLPHLFLLWNSARPEMPLVSINYVLKPAFLLALKAGGRKTCHVTTPSRGWGEEVARTNDSLRRCSHGPAHTPNLAILVWTKLGLLD